MDSDTASLHDIITHLKDENEHLRVKSQFQKETRNKLEQKICFLEKQIKESGKTITKHMRDEKGENVKKFIKQECIILKRNRDQNKRKSLCSSTSRRNEKHRKYYP